MMVIDSQVHAYEANTPKRPWHNVPNWPDHVTGDEMVTAMDKVGVDGAIFISAFSAGREASPTVAIIDSQTAKGAQKGGLGSILQATTRARRSRVASGTSWSTRWASC
jgi:predicted TIM-barrel fold metal-dependent hydrolase